MMPRSLPIVLAFAFGLWLPADSARALDRMITVTGEAAIAAAPDMAVVRIGVTSQGKTAREANDANAKTMTAVLASIKAAGIAENDIQTSQLALQPQMDTIGGKARLTGFQAINQLTVRIRDIGNLPGLLDRAIAGGANEMSGVEFIVSGQSKLLDKARADAIADARRKAEIYAHAAGASLGRTLAIAEGSASPSLRPMEAIRSSAVPIERGEQTLHASVTVSYELTQ
jgi:uncharacterized protein YggE